MIRCDSIFGNQVLIAKEKLTFRASVYAVLINEGKILLVHNRRGGKLALPGGGIEIGEPILNALRREVKEESGLEIEIDLFLRFQEQFFYYDPKDLAFHSFLFYYLCKPTSFDLIPDDQVDDRESEKPRWFDIAKLDKNEIQAHHWEVIEMAKMKLS
jgi:8-oxo-dGTP diphosphatase